MGQKTFLTVFFFLMGLGSVARADYGWVPGSQKLLLKTGMDLLSSSENFYTDGLDAIRLGANEGKLTDVIFYVEPEYGFTDQWSAALKIPFLYSTLASADGSLDLATASGLGDMWFRLKYMLKGPYPLYTLETIFKFPTGTSRVTAADELVLGDGNFDMGLKFHIGMKEGSFLFSLSPGLLGRFSGYASAATGEIAAQFQFPRGFVRVFSHGIFSFSEERLRDSTIDVHDAIGSGGSYTRLSGSPTGILFGGKVGMQFAELLAFEINASKTLWGVRYPNYFSIGFNLLFSFDFTDHEPAPKRYKEVPFEGALPSEY